MAYLFTPPQRTMTSPLHGSGNLRFSYQVSQTVWHDADGWHSEETPPAEVLAQADRIMAYPGRPEVVDDATAAELIAAGIGTCLQIT